MSKSNIFENDLLKLIFNGGAIANLADNAGSSPLGSLYVSLHTADPGEGGNQTTNEAAYTGYARAAVARSAAGWTVTGASVSPTNDINFAECTGGSASVTHFAIGTASSGAGKILYSGAVSPSLSISTGITPSLTTGSVLTED